jgi:hypothetical protein
MMKKIVLLISLSFLVLWINGCGGQDHSGMHMHSHEDVEGYESIQAEFTYGQSEVNSREDEEITITILDDQGDPIQDFDIAHEKLMHFIIVSKDLSYFDHIHPEYQGEGVFKVTTQFPAGGEYKLFADFIPKGQKQTIVNEKITVKGESVVTPLQVETNLTKEVDGKEVTLIMDHMMSGMDLELTFNLKDAETKEPIKDIQPYLGAVGHVIIISEDTENYLHVHPMEEEATGPDAKFMTNFPESGIYKIWGQFQHDGKILTVPFTVKIP